MASLSKNTALLLFCYFRQAERSVHYALSFPNEWPQFLAYYDKARRTQIAKVIDFLKDVGAELGMVPSRHEFEQNGWWSVVRCSAALLCNPLKHAWSFSTRELAFFSATLEHLLRILDYAEPREDDELIELRLDCFHCHYLIGHKLIGVPEIRKADAIEHFNQSEYVRHFTFQDLGIHCPCPRWRAPERDGPQSVRTCVPTKERGNEERGEQVRPQEGEPMNSFPAWLREFGGYRKPYDLGLHGTDWFWSVLDQVRTDVESAKVMISEMSPEQLSEFYYAYREATDELYGVYCDDERGWAEEAIHNASCWVLNHGKEFYLAVWNDLSKYPDPDAIEGVDYSGIAAHVSWERYRQELCG